MIALAIHAPIACAYLIFRRSATIATQRLLTPLLLLRLQLRWLALLEHEAHQHVSAGQHVDAVTAVPS